MKTYAFRSVKAFRPHLYAERFHWIENAPIYPWKWIKTETHTYRISVEGRKHIKMTTKTETIAGACVFSMRIEFD